MLHLGWSTWGDGEDGEDVIIIKGGAPPHLLPPPCQSGLKCHPASTPEYEFSVLVPKVKYIPHPKLEHDPLPTQVSVHYMGRLVRESWLPCRVYNNNRIFGSKSHLDLDESIDNEYLSSGPSILFHECHFAVIKQ